MIKDTKSTIMNFMQVAVLDKEDYELYSQDEESLNSWNWLTCGDEGDFALYDCDKQCVLIHEDGGYPCCGNAFLRGLQYGGTEVNVTKGYVVVEDRFSWEEICEKINNNEYVIVNDEEDE